MAVEVPMPDKHYSPQQVPATIQDPVGECYDHTTEVIRRAIRRRTKKLSSTLDGTSWEPPVYSVTQNEYAYTLRCPGPNCGEEMVALFFLPCNNAANEGIVCCSKCCEDFRRLANKFRVGVPGCDWEKLDQKQYCQFEKEAWQSSINCSLTLLQMNSQKSTTQQVSKMKKAKPKQTVVERANDKIANEVIDTEATEIPIATEITSPANRSGKRACEQSNQPSSRKRRALMTRLNKLTKSAQVIQEQIQDVVNELMNDDDQ